MLLYLLVYVLAVLGTFAALTHLGSEDREVDRVDELAGLARVRPFAAGAIGVFMFSLAGIPPLAGFWGKLALLAGAVNLATANSELWFGFAFLAVIGAVNVAIAAAYYLRIVAVMYFRAGSPVSPARGGWSSGAATATCALLVVLVGVMPAMAVRSAATAEQSLQLGKGAAAVSASHWSATDLAERPVRP
jgi:NADH-quinone oxidoreductase subunit N